MGDETLFDLTGMVAIVTGGAQGLGFAIASAFVNHGAAAVICDSNSAAARDSAARIATESTDRVCRSVDCDVRDRQQVADAIHCVMDEFGRIDILVNNAGIHPS